MLRTTIQILALSLITICSRAQIFPKITIHTDVLTTNHFNKATEELISKSSTTSSIIFTKDGLVVRTNLQQRFLLSDEPTSQISNKGLIVHFVWKAMDKDYQPCEFWISTLRKEKDKKTGAHHYLPVSISINYPTEGIMYQYDILKYVSTKEIYL